MRCCLSKDLAGSIEELMEFEERMKGDCSTTVTFGVCPALTVVSSDSSSISSVLRSLFISDLLLSGFREIFLPPEAVVLISIRLGA